VFLGEKIAYTDANADYVLVGSLVDTHTRENVTARHMSERGTVAYRALPFDRAIKVVKGNGKRQFAVFSDPDCPYCQQLEKELVSVTDVTIYIFLFPIGSLHPQAPARAHAIWCAKDRQQAWTQWMLERKAPQGGTCTGDPIEELQKLGEQLYINGTPTLFLANGQRVAGVVNSARLEQLLATAPHAP
jgi:thiol:disulfide interchange protein DsbC